MLADKKKRLEISVFLNRLDELRVEIKKIHEDILICDAQYDNVENEIARRRKNSPRLSKSCRKLLLK